MFAILAETPPEVAFFLGFFMALALRRARLESLIDAAFGVVAPDGAESAESASESDEGSK